MPASGGVKEYVAVPSLPVTTWAVSTSISSRVHVYRPYSPSTGARDQRISTTVRSMRLSASGSLAAVTAIRSMGMGSPALPK